MRPEKKFKNMREARQQAQLKAVHRLLDMLELPARDEVTGDTKLYASLLVGTLLRSLSVTMKVPKSKRRARALGILVAITEGPNPNEPDTRARKPAQIARRKLITVREQDLIYEEYFRLIDKGLEYDQIAKRFDFDCSRLEEIIDLVERRRKAKQSAGGREPPRELT
jgi:hypothetical protein